MVMGERTELVTAKKKSKTEDSRNRTQKLQFFRGFLGLGHSVIL